MASGDAAEPARSLGTIVKELTTDLSTLFRSEIALVKLEIRQAAAKLGTGGALLASALALAIFGLGFFFVTIVLGLVALGVPAWLSTLIVALVLFAGAAVLALRGKQKLEEVEFVPTEAIEQIRSDIETIRSDVTRVRSR